MGATGNLPLTMVKDCLEEVATRDSQAKGSTNLRLEGSDTHMHILNATDPWYVKSRRLLKGDADLHNSADQEAQRGEETCPSLHHKNLAENKPSFSSQ